MSVFDLFTAFCNNHPYLSISFAGFLGFITDFVWAKWAANVGCRRAFNAANWSVLIYTCGLLYTMLIVDHQGYHILAYLVGSYFGTLVAVKTTYKDNLKNEQIH